MKKGKPGLSSANLSRISHCADHGIITSSAGSNPAVKAASQSASSVETATNKKSDNDANIQTFDDDDNEWELGVGNLIIDLDADLERNDPSPAPTQHSQTMSADMEHQATVDKGLKMKIKRKTLRTLDSGGSNKHGIPKEKGTPEKDSKNSNSDSKNKRAVLKKEKNKDKEKDKDKEKKESAALNGFPHGSNAAPAGGKSDDPYEFNAKVEDRIRVPVKKPKIEKSTTPPCSPTSKSSQSAEKLQSSNSDSAKSECSVRKNASTDTMDMSTCTEPEFLGPCEPGTSVLLGGIVWQETENGVLVVNVTWRGKTYVGTLLDATQHDWAPPRFNCESPTSETPKGRGVKRNCRVGVGTPVENIIETRKLRKGRRGGSTRSFQAPPSPAKSDITPMSSAKRKQRSAEMDSSDDMKNKPCRSISRGTPTEQERKPNSQGYIECPEVNCSKKYRHMNGLKYHQSHAHSSTMEGDDSSGSRPGTPITPSTNENQNHRIKEFEFGESDEPPADANDDDTSNQASESKLACTEASTFSPHVSISTLAPNRENKEIPDKKERETESAQTASKGSETPLGKSNNESDQRQETKSPAQDNSDEFTENVHSPAYSDISDAADTAPPLGPDKGGTESSDSKQRDATSESSVHVTSGSGYNAFAYAYGQKQYLMPPMAEKAQTKSPNTQVESSHRNELRQDSSFHDEYGDQSKMRIDTSVAQPLFSPGQQHMSMLTAYGYIDPAFHHSPIDNERYREQSRLLDEQKSKAESGKQVSAASGERERPVPRPKESSEKPISSNVSNAPPEVSETKPSEVRVKKEPIDSLIERHHEDLKRYYMAQKQQDQRAEEADRYEEQMRAALKIKQEPKPVADRSSRHDQEKVPDTVYKPDLKRPRSPQEKSVIQEKRSKSSIPSPATTPKTSKPPTPTLIPTYNQYAVAPGFIQGPYGQVQFDPHSAYRGVGTMPAPLIGFPGPAAAAYMHPALRYPAPSFEKEKQVMMSQGSRHPGLHEPPKALDLLQQHASFYNTSQHHKIHELERAGRSETGTPPKPRTGPSPVSVSVSAPKDIGLHSSPRHASPPPQRHVHTHHHTHLMGGYPIYDPYGAIINAGQGPSGLPPGAIGHPFPPK